MYFPLSVLLCWNMKTEQKYTRAFFAIGTAALWGLFMEFMQLSTHLGRSFSWFDEFANLAGAVCGALIYVLVTQCLAEKP
jgi:VanZ family protein